MSVGKFKCFYSFDPSNNILHIKKFERFEVDVVLEFFWRKLKLAIMSVI